MIRKEGKAYGGVADEMLVRAPSAMEVVDHLVEQLAVRIAREHPFERPERFTFDRRRNMYTNMHEFQVTYLYDSLADEPTRDLNESIGRALSVAHDSFDQAIGRLGGSREQRETAWLFAARANERIRNRNTHRNNIRQALALAALRN